MPAEQLLELEHTRCALCGADRPLHVASGYDFEYDTVLNEFSFVRCADCGHVYLEPRPRSEDLGIIYPSNYYAFGGREGGLVRSAQRRWEAGKVRLYREFVGDGQKRLLDVGCGDGRFLRLLRDFGPEGWTPVGLEFDEGAIAKCRSDGFEAYATRIEDFAEDDEHRGLYDCVIMLQLIEHVEDPALVTEKVFQLLRPGGVFVIETPDLAGLDHRLFKRRHWGHYHFPRHWNLFSTESLCRMIESKKFEIVRTEQLISTSAWIISHYNYFKERGCPRFFVDFWSYKNPLLLGVFVILDTLRIRLGLKTSNQRVIARKPTTEREVGA